MNLTNDELLNYQKAIEKEWLLTNGLGGFASSTTCGCNTRKYHALLCAAIEPPHNRKVLVSKVNESIVMNEKEYDISTNECEEYISKGFQYQSHFNKKPFPTFEYIIDNVNIKKELCMVHLENTIIVRYIIQTGATPIIFKMAPLVNNRDFHSTNNTFVQYPELQISNDCIKVIYDSENDLYMYNNFENYVMKKNENYNNMYYRNEKERGLDCIENHFIPGIFSSEIDANTTKCLCICFSTIPHNNLNISDEFAKEAVRQQRLTEKAGIYDEYGNALVIAADQFIVKDKEDNYGIIAGYPWFDVWGRDTFISFEGLLLVTKRFDIAKNILVNSLLHVKDGLIPNTYNSKTGEGLYNSVDASLLFFEALYKYLKYTNDYTIVDKKMYDILVDIIMSYVNGTLYNIHLDNTDGLLISGAIDLNLTWMDAKIGNEAITPRHGKCVEINALWYNALCILIEIGKKNFPEDKSINNTLYYYLANKCKESFAIKFWNSSKDCLYDTIQPYSLEVRPNQLLAISLSFAIYDNQNAKIMLDTVHEQLVTPFGIRTLSPYSKKYVGHYLGDINSRDRAYHQGTVWPWLLSEYVIAFCKVNNYVLKENKWISYIETLKDNINSHCIGQISEIFDGDEPYTPRGAFAQAWSVGNMLKLYSEV